MAVLAQEPVDEFTSDLVAARVMVAHVARWARRYLVTRGGGAADGACCCGTPRCELADVPGGAEACRLAVDLARLPVGEHGAARALRVDSRREEIAGQYLHSVRGAAGAVYFCQRVQHLMGECWFSTDERPGQDLCARTLGLAHLLRRAPRSLV
jgi:hypothetical protein